MRTEFEALLQNLPLPSQNNKSSTPLDLYTSFPQCFSQLPPHEPDRIPETCPNLLFQPIEAIGLDSKLEKRISMAGIKRIDQLTAGQNAVEFIYAVGKKGRIETAEKLDYYYTVNLKKANCNPGTREYLEAMERFRSDTSLGNIHKLTLIQGGVTTLEALYFLLRLPDPQYSHILSKPLVRIIRQSKRGPQLFRQLPKLK